MSLDTPNTKAGYAAIVGRPNVGKSTLLNRLLGQKMAITSHKPQTTRHQILGIYTEGGVQVVYIDTPGIHQRGEKAMNRYLNRTAHTALLDVNVAIFVVRLWYGPKKMPQY
jgi:GTP-binding protein Era